MTEAVLAWRHAGDAGEALVEAARRRPGWYWVLRPHQQGPGRYDPDTPVACPIYIFGAGPAPLSSPLADLRSLEPDQLVPRDTRGARYPSLFAGPLEPGPSLGVIRVERDPDGRHRVIGAMPAVPGWYWCRTNPEAPLLHVDEAGIGPIYLDTLNAAVHVWSAATLEGRPIDVGELGFSEPLVSPGGVIDASGELGRTAVELFGGLELPPPPARPIWSALPPDRSPALVLSAGETTLRVSDLARARAFYEKLGFRVDEQRPEEGWAQLTGGGVRLRLVTGRGAALHFQTSEQARAALDALGVVPEASPEGLVVVDPDGHRLVLSPAVPEEAQAASPASRAEGRDPE